MKKYVQSALVDYSHLPHRGNKCIVCLALFVVMALSSTISWGQGAECPAPADFNLMTPCYLNGSRAANPNEDVIVLWNHTASRGASATKEVIADYSEVGTVWGLASHAQTKKLYAAAFLKRHADLSPDGLGAIYEIDLTTPTTAGAGTPTLWMNLNSATHYYCTTSRNSVFMP